MASVMSTEKESCYRGGSFCILTKMHQINVLKKQTSKIQSHLPLLCEFLHAQSSHSNRNPWNWECCLRAHFGNMNLPHLPKTCLVAVSVSGASYISVTIDNRPFGPNTQQEQDVNITSGWRWTWCRTDVAFWLRMKIGLMSVFDANLTLA